MAIQSEPASGSQPIILPNIPKFLLCQAYLYDPSVPVFARLPIAYSALRPTYEKRAIKKT
jgi:hypothetical protein